MRQALLALLLPSLLLLLALLPPDGAAHGDSGREREPGPGPGPGPGRTRREEPPLSIDLTFHLLRHMLRLARTQSQRAQAEQNRLVLDAVGK
ncbi:urocortin [Alligator mississippiensis]|uniref:urocortin n=1 Tax=Alligator mississippiensis TaxID=8496 RepID=UPI0003D0D83D|nr:urocortin [Alligator mississippiensis]